MQTRGHTWIGDDESRWPPGSAVRVAVRSAGDAAPRRLLRQRRRARSRPPRDRTRQQRASTRGGAQERCAGERPAAEAHQHREAHAARIVGRVAHTSIRKDKIYSFLKLRTPFIDRVTRMRLNMMRRLMMLGRRPAALLGAAAATVAGCGAWGNREGGAEARAESGESGRWPQRRPMMFVRDPGACDPRSRSGRLSRRGKARRTGAAAAWRQRLNWV